MGNKVTTSGLDDVENHDMNLNVDEDESTSTDQNENDQMYVKSMNNKATTHCLDDNEHKMFKTKVNWELNINGNTPSNQMSINFYNIDDWPDMHTWNVANV